MEKTEKTTNLTYQEALSALANGKKVKLPEWGGYWFYADGIKVKTKDGEILNTPWFDKYKDRNDWQILTK